MITEPGIYLNIDPTEYLNDPCPEPSFSQSIGKILLDASPAHAFLAHPRLAPPATEDEPAEKYVAARVIGDAAHAALIGRGKQIAEADFPDWRKKEAQAFRTDAELHGKTAILKHHADRAREMVKATSFQLEAAGHASAFRKGNGEVVLAWQEDGRWLRCMVDWMVDATRIYDFKSTALSVAPHVVIDRPSTDGWDIQAAMIDRGLNVLAPDTAGRRRFFFINQENQPPYALVPVEISRSDLTLGHKKLQMAFDIWCDCVSKSTWPLYPPETVMSVPRGYTETKFLDREIAHSERRTRKREPMLTDLSGG